MVPAKRVFRVKNSEKLAAQLLMRMDRKAGRSSDPFVVKLAQAGSLAHANGTQTDSNSCCAG